MAEKIIRLICTLAFGYFGAAFFKKKKVASAAMLGSMTFVAVAGLAGFPVWIHSDWKVYVQILSGIVIGSRIRSITIEDVAMFRKPLMIILSVIVLFNFIIGTLIALCSRLDVPTAMFAAAPGGTSDITILAPEYGADPAVISLFHEARQLEMYLIIPFLLSKSDRKKDMALPTPKTKTKGVGMQGGSQIILLIVFAAACGLLLKCLFSSGAILGAIIGTVLFVKRFRTCRVPAFLRLSARVFAGIFVGIRFTRTIILELYTLFFHFSFCRQGWF